MKSGTSKTFAATLLLWAFVTPVVTDNDYETWNAYDVEAWPTAFLLDKQGRIRWMHVGEGDYDEADRLIQKLLAENDHAGK